MSTYAIRTFGDPVLRKTAEPVSDIDGKLVALVDAMVETMYHAQGVGLAAPQIGVGKQLFVYDAGEGPITAVNPEIVESSGSWTYDEGCLSVPGLSFDIVRPNKVTFQAIDLDGAPLEFEADEFLGRVLQHEMDHLQGVLLLDHLDPDQRKEAFRQMREQQLNPSRILPSHKL